MVGRELLKLRLAACLNILGKVDSFYQWKGKIEKSSEVAMIIKTRRSLFTKVSRCVKKHHSYQVPVILEWSVSRGDESYLKWMLNETRN